MNIIQSTVNSAQGAQTPKPTTVTADSATPAVKGSLQRGNVVSLLNNEVYALKEKSREREQIALIAFVVTAMLASFVAIGILAALVPPAALFAGGALFQVAMFGSVFGAPTALAAGAGLFAYFFPGQREHYEGIGKSINLLESEADKLGRGGRMDDLLNETEMQELLEKTKVRPKLNQQIIEKLQTSEREFEQRLARLSKNSEVAPPPPPPPPPPAAQPKSPQANQANQAKPAPRLRQVNVNPSMIQELVTAQRARGLRTDTGTN